MHHGYKNLKLKYSKQLAIGQTISKQLVLGVLKF